MLSPIQARAAERWADDLQDGTLQGLVALRLLLVSGLNRGEEGTLRQAVQEALAQIDGEIGDLRAVIAEMRDT